MEGPRDSLCLTCQGVRGDVLLPQIYSLFDVEAQRPVSYVGIKLLLVDPPSARPEAHLGTHPGEGGGDGVLPPLPLGFYPAAGLSGNEPREPVGVKLLLVDQPSARPEPYLGGHVGEGGGDGVLPPLPLGFYPQAGPRGDEPRESPVLAAARQGEREPSRVCAGSAKPE